MAKTVYSRNNRQQKAGPLGKKKILIFSGIGVFLVLAVILAGQRGSKESEKDAVQTIPVVVSTVSNGNLSRRIKLTGEIKGQDQADIYPDVPGKISRILVREGQYINQGQVVAEIDRNMVGMVYKPATVTAPISGSIGKVYVDRGMTVAQNVPLMMIADTRTVEGVLQVPEKYAPYFRVGQQAVVSVPSYPDRVFRGVVYKKGSMINPATRTLEVKLRLNNPGGRILPGNYADFSVEIKRLTDQTIVPFDAIVDTIEKQEVFVVHEREQRMQPKDTGDRPDSGKTASAKEASKEAEAAEKPEDEEDTEEKKEKKKFYVAERREVRIGVQDGTRVQVLDGLKPGEKVVTFGKENVIDEAELRVIQSEEDAKKEKQAEERTNEMKTNAGASADESQ